MAQGSFAGLDQVKPAEPESGFDLYILSMHEKPGWQCRTAGDRLHVAHPGSAISYEDELYELIRVEPATGTPYAYRYALHKWEDKYAVRQVFPYSLEMARETGRKLIEQRKQHQQHTWAIYWFALTSALPTPLATRWQREWGLPMRRAAVVSVILLSALAMTLGPYVQRTHPGSPVAVFLLFLQFEQVVRVFWLMGGTDAVGSLGITTVWSIAMILAGNNPDGSARRRKVKDFEIERDEVRYLTRGDAASTQPWDIEVRSLFRDPVLVGASPVRFDGQIYQPLGCFQEGEGIRRRYVFRLKTMDPGAPARREYFPLRTREQVAALLPYEESRDRVNALSFLVGFLPSSRQVELERKYEYNATLWTQRSAWVMLFSAGMQLFFLWGMKIGPPHLVAAYFLLESGYRLAVAYTRAEPIGSLFGWVFYALLRKA